MATVGTPTAAAMCINPESLVTNIEHRLIKPMAAASDVRLQRFNAGLPMAPQTR